MLVQELYQFINSPNWFSGLIIMVTAQNTYTIMILDDEEDILTLYSDYLSNMGHRMLSTYVNADSILQDIGIEPPDIYIIDYRLPSNMNGVEVAIEILKKFHLACIIFITAFEMLEKELSKQDIFCDKKIDVLIKPIKLNRIQNSLLSPLSK